MRTPDAAHQPPCRGDHDLFDSVHRADHYEARLLCDTCPFTLWCAHQLKEAHLAGWHPSGTWAGRLIGKATT